MRPCSVRHVLVDMLCAALVCQVYRVQNKVSSAAHIAGQGRTRPAALGAQRGARQLHRQLASCQCNLDVDSGHAFILWWKQKTTTVLIAELKTNLASACRGKYLCFSFYLLGCHGDSTTSGIVALLSNSCRCGVDFQLHARHKSLGWWKTNPGKLSVASPIASI
jgi:hypothetical protein